MGTEAFRYNTVRYPQKYVANAFAASTVIRANPGTLISLTAYNSNASTRYLMLFDSATVPADTTVPLMVVAVPTESLATVDYGIMGFPFVNGLAVAFSSTDTQLTAIATADGLFTATYR